MRVLLRVAALCLGSALLAACASPAPAPPQPPARARGASPIAPSAGAAAASAALSVVGAPYRYGGSSPTGFDCSGLVLYSYARAGHRGLPHSASALERLAAPVPVDALEPGDLLFFRLGGVKASHVAIYVGDGAFVHAPSSGGRVERVDFDHVYWGPRVRRAGRLRF